MMFPSDDLDSNLRRILQRAVHLGSPAGSAEYLLAELEYAVSFWEGFIRIEGKRENGNDPSVLDAIAESRRLAPRVWLEPRIVRGTALTAEFSAVEELFRSYRCTIDSDRYFSEKALFDFALVAEEETVASLALTKLCGLSHEQLVNKTREQSFFPDDWPRPEK